ncbi:MAG: hypothetical protein MUF31_16030 [Akkermansiaceae bacterium]|nr:hypothetical protein [Akkermansiaceae bacterium]
MARVKALFSWSLLPLVACALLASCGAGGGSGEGGETATGGSPEAVPRVRSGEMFDDDSAAMLDRYGKANPMFDGGERSSANESTQTNNQFTGEYARREFNAKNYERQPFWGRKDYERQVYGGDTDGSRFLQGAREGSMTAREGGEMAADGSRAFGTRTMDGGSAREAGVAEIGRGSDAETDVRRRVFPQPEKRPSGQQRAMTVEDARALMGR